MDALLLIKAAFIGFSIAAPVGPIALLCIQRTLNYGARTGLVSGLGAAVADGLYGAIGALGLAAITRFFLSLSLPLAIAGGLFLGWMGLRMLSSSPPDQKAKPVAAAEVMGHGRAFGSVFALTLTNPMTILSFIGVFAAIGGDVELTASTNLMERAGLMVFGVLIGSAAWWCLLVFGVAAIRQKISQTLMRRINQCAGVFLLAFAAWQLISIVL